LVASSQRTTKGDCLGCAKEGSIKPRTLWGYGCQDGLNKPAYHIYPPSLLELTEDKDAAIKSETTDDDNAGADAVNTADANADAYTYAGDGTVASGK